MDKNELNQALSKIADRYRVGAETHKQIASVLDLIGEINLSEKLFDASLQDFEAAIELDKIIVEETEKLPNCQPLNINIIPHELKSISQETFEKDKDKFKLYLQGSLKDWLAVEEKTKQTYEQLKPQIEKIDNNKIKNFIEKLMEHNKKEISEVKNMMDRYEREGWERKPMYENDEHRMGYESGYRDAMEGRGHRYENDYESDYRGERGGSRGGRGGRSYYDGGESDYESDYGVRGRSGRRRSYRR